MNKPFIESKTIYRFISSSMSNSIDTSAIDAYRQGVELTLDPYFYDGVVKIWSGEPNHRLPQRQFGEPNELEIFPDNTFYTELDKFNSVNFLLQKKTPKTSQIIAPITFQPTATERLTLDGIVEPLTIRQSSIFATNNALFHPFEVHAFHGNIAGGNFNQIIGSDIIVHRVQVNQEHHGVMHFSDITNVQTTYLSDKTTQSPFADTQLKGGLIVDSNIKGLLLNAMQKMSCSSENYCPPGYRVYPSGFTWMNTKGGVGSDSLAFGDLAYKSTV